MMGEAVESARGAIASSTNAMVANIVVVAAIVAAALLVQHALVKLIRTRLSATGVGSVSIFENLARAVVWLLAAIVVCKPVFGIEPTAMVAAFGVGSLVISLGLQDTISNVFSGLQMSAHGVVRVGDHVEIDGIRGVVSDITWRQTTIIDKDGDTEIFPNSYLNKVMLKQLLEEDGYRHMFDIEVRPDADLDAVGADIASTAREVLAREGYLQEGLDPIVRFAGHTAYGIKTSVRIYIKDERMTTAVIDAVMRALKQRSYLSDATVRRTQL